MRGGMNAKLAELRKCTELRSSYSWGSVMRDAEPLAAVRDPADGMTATVYRGPVGFRVVFRDDDSSSIVEVRNFVSEARALEYARRLIGAPR